MKGEIYRPGMPVKLEDLNFAKFSVQDSISDRSVDLMTPGILWGSRLSRE